MKSAAVAAITWASFTPAARLASSVLSALHRCAVVHLSDCTSPVSFLFRYTKTYHCVTVSYSILYGNTWYRPVAWEQSAVPTAQVCSGLHDTISGCVSALRVVDTAMKLPDGAFLQVSPVVK